MKKVQAFGRPCWPQHYCALRAGDAGLRQRPLRGGGNLVSLREGINHCRLRSSSMKEASSSKTTAPFQGLPELVADAEGLFAKEGLQIEWVERESDDKSTHTNVNSPKGLDPFSSHGKMLEQGKADMYNACEWGNYCLRPGYRAGRQPPSRTARASSPTRPSWCGRIRSGIHRPAIGRQDGRRAVLFRHPLSGAAPARRFHAARRHQALPHVERFTAAL